MGGWGYDNWLREMQHQVNTDMYLYYLSYLDSLNHVGTIASKKEYSTCTSSSF